MNYVKIKKRSFLSAMRGLFHFLSTSLLRKKEFKTEITELRLSLILPSPTTFSFHIAKYGSWEGHTSNWIIKKFSDQNCLCFIDIGANFGWYTCLFSTIGKENSHVFSVEPSPDNLFFLKKNINKNKLKNISLVECAVGEKENSLPLYFANSKNPGAHSLIKDTPQQNSTSKYLKVDVNTLDSLFKDLEIIHLMKIDIEGFELNALKGGLKTLKKVQNLLIEFSPHLWKDPYNDARNFFKILNDIGLKPNILESEFLKELNKSDIDLILEFLKNRDLNNLPISKVQKDLIFTKA
ncbi:MAG: FkbM family methyltransferase [Flavobacteriales bacterium]